MKNKLILAMSLMALLSLVSVSKKAPLVWAQESPGQETIKESLKKRLEGTVSEKLERVKGVLEESNQLYGYFGKITASQDNNLTLARNGQERIVLLNDQTTLLLMPASGSRQTINAEDISPGWYALAMGKADDEGKLQAQRIIFYEESPSPDQTRQVLFGKVAEIDTNKLELKNHQNRIFSILKTTQLTISGVAKPDIADVTVDDKAVVIFEESQEEELELLAVFVWPGTANPEAADNQVNADESTASAEAEETD